MKLFKSLLVAPATLSLLVPMSVSANDLNLKEVSNYSSSSEVQSISEFNANQLANTNSRVDGLEARINDFEAGSFSTTTTASFSVDMAIGAVDGNAIVKKRYNNAEFIDSSKEQVVTAYGYQMDLSTSFTGEDSLDVAIKAGTGASPLNELDLNSDGDSLLIDGISYTFPLGDKATILVGDTVDGNALYNTACVYGGFTNTLDDCGNASSAFEKPDNSVGLSASYDIGNGFTGAIGIAGQGTSNGLLNKESTDYFGGQVAYSADSYGVSVTYATLEGTYDSNVWGLNGYYTPEGNFPSISVGYETTDAIAEPAVAKDATQWFVGLQYDEFGPGTLGIAAGNKGPIQDGATEEMAYEAFYSYPLNDGMTITPAFFVLENNLAGETDETGVVVKTSFSF